MKTDTVKEIMRDLIDLPEKQMRRDIDRDDLHALADNIKANGLINPITVRPVGNRFQLVAGQRRLLAMGIAGIIRIPCVVRDLTDDDAINVMAAENIERADVDLIDESNFIKLAMEASSADVSGMAKRMNRSEKYVANRLAVAEMPDYMQTFLKSGELKLGSALLLMQIEDEAKRRLWVGMAIEQNATERQVDYWIYQHKLGTLPDAIRSEDDVPGAPASEYKQDMFVCAVDGKEYPAGDCTAVFVYKGNISTLETIRREIVAQSEPPVLSHI
ncbi:MAG: ParB/RepB/Spo0J family partition protein [Patescibacteria group bacterium]